MGIHYHIDACTKADYCEWDDFVLSHPQGHRMQTSCWAYTKIPSGWEIFLLTAHEDEKLLGGALLYQRKLPLFGSLVCLPKGPLCADCGRDLLPELEHKAREWAQTNHCLGLLVQPANQSQHLVEHLLAEKHTLIPDMNLTPPGTIIVDLEANEEVLFNNLSKAKRKNIRRAKKENIHVKVELKRECLDVFYPLHLSSSKNLGFEPDTKKRFEIIWENLSPKEHILFFTSYFENQPISSIMALSFCKTIICYRFGWSKAYPEKRPNDYLYWETIRWAKANGYKYLDFGEIHLEAARQITQTNTLPPEFRNSSEFFKLGFGGKTVLYPETYIYIHNPILRWMYQFFICRLIQFSPVQKLLFTVTG